MTALDPRTLQSMHHCPVESKIARKIIRDLKKAGNPILDWASDLEVKSV